MEKSNRKPDVAFFHSRYRVSSASFGAVSTIFHVSDIAALITATTNSRCVNVFWLWMVVFFLKKNGWISR